MPSAESRPAPPWASGTQGREHELYPTLSSDEIAILRGYGEERAFPDGAALWSIADRHVPFYVVLEGALEILRNDETGSHVFVTHKPGSYSGEVVNMLGRGAIVAGSATAAVIARAAFSKASAGVLPKPLTPMSAP